MAFRQCFLKNFFDTPEVTKIVLPKVLQNFKKTPNCSCWHKELNQKGLPRNIQYRTRLKGPPFSLFSALRDFVSIKKFPKCPLSIFFLEFCDRMDVEKSQRIPPFSFFQHCETFFRKFFRVL